MISLPAFNLAGHQELFANAVEQAQSDRVVQRFWDRDHSLWASTPDEIENRLGWLDVASRMRTEIPNLESFAAEIKSAGIEKVLLLGMGGSSLAPEVFSRIFGSAPGFPTLSILDSTDPRAVKSKLDTHDPAKTLYIVATKSGGTVETLSFLKIFYQQAIEVLGPEQASKHFAAITDPGSKLEKLARDLAFRQIFLNDPNIGGRYSALSHFGLVPAALLGIDLALLLEQAANMEQACKQTDVHRNPGLLLGLALGILANQDINKLTFFLPPPLYSFGDWLEQLIAESTGKSGKGILPVLGNQPKEIVSFGQDRTIVDISLAAQQNPRSFPHPSIHIAWPDIYAIGGQIFLWEFATAIAGHHMQIHPFNQPDVESAKLRAREVLSNYENDGSLPAQSRLPLSVEAIDNLLAKAQSGAYISIHAYSPATEATAAALGNLKKAFENRTGLATTLGYGPRFLHSTGQLHKGDAGLGLFIQLMDPSSENLAIPNEAGSSESSLTFEVLKRAQAAGDANALLAKSRSIVQMQIEGDFAEAIESLAREIL